VRSAATGRRVLLDDVLEEAHRDAVAAQTHDGVRAALRAWPDLRGVLGGPALRT
jgi:hypothetical protein